MKYSDKLTESAFKQNPDGEGWLYYLNGIFSKGRIIKDIETKEKVFNIHKNMNTYGKVLGSLLFIISVLLDNFFILAIYLLCLLVLQFFIVKNLPVSKHKLTLTEQMSGIAQELPTWSYKLLYALSGIMLIYSISLPLIFNKLYSVIIPVSLFGIGISIIGFIIGTKLHKLKA